MFHARIKEVCEDQSVYYLVTNRVAGGRFLFRYLEKQMLKELLFGGVDRLSYQVVDYIFMDNHFHLIVKIPAIDKISESELLKRYRTFKNDPEIDFFTDTEKLDFKFKIHDISFIIGNFEQRFVQWFNREHNSWGRLFGQRFDSELIEVSEQSDSLLRCMAYVTLNPVRAGILKDPKDFHFCGYADRVANNKIGLNDDEFFDLFCHGIEATSDMDKRSQFQQVFRAYMLGLKRFKLADSLTIKEYLIQTSSSPPEALRWDDLFIHKCRFFTKCLVIGSEAFIRDKLNKFADKMHWKREHQPYTEDEWDGIHSLKSKRRSRRGAPAG